MVGTALSRIAAAVALIGLASPASAEPVRITDGYIQVGLLATDFLIRVSGDVDGFAGEFEGVTSSPTMLSGMSGDIVSLSSTYSSWLSGFSIFDPDRVDTYGRAHFEFTGGNSEVPPLADAMSGGARAFAPFTFTGYFTTFASQADAMANANALARYDVFGAGRAEALFRVQMTNVGEPLPNLPLVSSSIVYRFSEADPAPVPEPGTLMLLAGGLAATAARVRRRGRTR